MATADSVKQKLRGLIDSANQTTSGSDTTLTDAVTRLQDGFCAGKLTGMANPASESDVVSGKEYIGEDGFLHTGNMPERSDMDVHLTASDITQNVNVTVDSGYYPEPITLYGKAGGNANVNAVDVDLTVGSTDFDGVSIGLKYIYYPIFESFIGTGIYYMPASCMILLDKLIILNGAFYSDNIDFSKDDKIFFIGNDINGTYKLELELSELDVLKSVTLTNNGETVDASGITVAKFMVTKLLVD